MRLWLEWYLYDVETYGTLTIGCGVFYTSFIMWGIHFCGVCLLHGSLLFPIEWNILLGVLET